MNKYRYPGPSPFHALQEDIFFGRDGDAEQLFNSILLNNCTILVGKSGVGKSSLLNAKIIPRFTVKNNTPGFDKRHFVVVKISVGPWSPKTENKHYDNLLQKITKRVQEQLGILKQKRFLTFLDASGTGSLSLELKQYQFEYFLANKNIILLMIIDQIEELFTYPYEELKQLIAAIKEIISPHVPEHLREEIESIEKNDPQKISAAENEVLYSPLPVKFLFSIRSDKLGLLIRLKDAIPNIFSNPYELKPLSREQAYDAIKLPSSKEGDFETAPFIITDNTINKILDYLQNLPNSDLENNAYELNIDPISLQIVCQHIELKIAPYDKDKMIEVHEINNLDDIFSNYYLNALKRVESTEVDLRTIRNLLEEKFIYEPDKRRRQLFLDECEVDVTVIRQLIECKLLREITDASGRNYYEVAHDWLILPILSAKKQRLEEERRLQADRVNVLLKSAYYESGNESIEFTNMLSKADHYYNLRDYEKAIGYYNRYIQVKDIRNKKDKEVLFKRGDCFYKLKQYDKAVDEFLQYLAFNPEEVPVLFNLAYSYHILYQLEKAVQYYEAVIELDGTHINSYFNLGVIYQEQGHLKESKEMFHRVLLFSSNDADAWYNAGVISNQLGEYREAIKYLAEAIRLQSKKIEAYYEIAAAYVQLSDFPNAIAKFYDVWNIDNSNLFALQQIGKISHLTGNIKEAERAYLLELSIDNPDAEIYFKLAEIDANNGEWNSALLFVNKSIALNPDNFSTLLLQAKISKALDDKDLLIEVYTTIIHKGEATPEIFYDIIELLFQKEEYEIAIDFFRLGYNMIMTDVPANFGLAIIFSNYHFFNEAGFIINAILDKDPENLACLELQVRMFELSNDQTKMYEVYRKILESAKKRHYDAVYIEAIENKMKQLPESSASFKKACEIYDQLMQTIAQHKNTKIKA